MGEPEAYNVKVLKGVAKRYVNAVYLPFKCLCCPVTQVGFKPAGGIRTAQESVVWLTLMKEELGDEWLSPHLFRLGASSLLADIERQVGGRSRRS